MDATDRERLVKLCGMLGSDFDGERAAAALKVSSFLKARRLTWADVIARPPYSAGAAQPQPQPRPEPKPTRSSPSGMSPQAYVEWFLFTTVPWTPWERKFLSSIQGRAQLSERQWEVVDRMLRKAELAGWRPWWS